MVGFLCMKKKTKTDHPKEWASSSLISSTFPALPRNFFFFFLSFSFSFSWHAQHEVAQTSSTLIWCLRSTPDILQWLAIFRWRFLMLFLRKSCIIWNVWALGDSTHTVDGSEILRSPVVEVGSLSHYLQGFLYISGGFLAKFQPSTVSTG